MHLEILSYKKSNRGIGQTYRLVLFYNEYKETIENIVIAYILIRIDLYDDFDFQIWSI